MQNWEEIAKKEQERANSLEFTLLQVKELLEEERKESTNSFNQLQKLKEKIEKRAEAAENNLQRLIIAVKNDKAKSLEIEKKKDIDYNNKIKIAEERIDFLENQLKKEGNLNQDILKIQKQMEQMKLDYEEKISTLTTEKDILKNKLQIVEEQRNETAEELEKALEVNKQLRNSVPEGNNNNSSEEIERYKKEAQVNKEKCEKLNTALKNLQEKTKKMVELISKERKETQIMIRNSQGSQQIENNINTRNSSTSNNQEYLQKISELEKTVSDLRQQLQEANEKLQNTPPQDTSSGPPGMDAPPPPPPPPVFEIKPVRIVIQKQEGQSITPLPRKSQVTVIKPTIDFISELKGGIKLKKVEKPEPISNPSNQVNSNVNFMKDEGFRRSRAFTNDHNPMGMISQLAVKMAKDRQTRILEGNVKLAPVRSKRLDNLLDKIN